MFEEEKEIRLHNDKPIRLASAYVKNTVRYCNKKVYIPYLEIWGSRQCNLNCKECISRMPFVKPKTMLTDTVVNSIKTLSAVAILNVIYISGGEPFLNEDLYKIIVSLGKIPEVRKIYILSNATILPHSKTLSALENVKKNVKIVLNEYQGVQNRISDIKFELKKRKIPYTVRRLGKYYWNGIGNDITQMMHFETGRMIYDDCKMKRYAVLCEDILTKCPRGICQDTLDDTIEYLRVSKLKKTTASRAKLATCLDSTIHKEYCRMCFGISKENPYIDEPGIQID